MTGLGFVVMVVFLASYIAMTFSSGMEGNRAKLIQWGCWAIAMLTMLLCYVAAPSSPA